MIEPTTQRPPSKSHQSTFRRWRREGSRCLLVRAQRMMKANPIVSIGIMSFLTLLLLLLSNLISIPIVHSFQLLLTPSPGATSSIEDDWESVGGRLVMMPHLRQKKNHGRIIKARSKRRQHNHLQRQKRDVPRTTLYVSRGSFDGIHRKEYVDRDSYWVYMFYLLMLYRDREGDCNVPYGHIEDGWDLGVWLSQQKSAYKHNRLSEIRTTRLEDAGVIWDKSCEQKWNMMYEYLLEFKSKNGHCIVPQKEGPYNLGQWLNTQRRMDKAGKLSLERTEKLEQIGVIWDVYEYQWNTMFQRLLEFKEEYGHCDVPVSYQQDEKGLGSWLANQRRFYRDGQLHPTRQHLLKEIAGICFTESKLKRWDHMLSLLESYKQREGHCNVPQNYIDVEQENGGNHENLGQWLMNQKKQYSKGTLSKDRQQRLEDVGIHWPIISATKWDQMFRLLEEYYNENGHANVPNKYVVATSKDDEDGTTTTTTKLGVWLKNQKYLWRVGKLKESRKQRLESLGVKVPCSQTVDSM